MGRKNGSSGSSRMRLENIRPSDPNGTRLPDMVTYRYQKYQIPKRAATELDPCARRRKRAEKKHKAQYRLHQQFVGAYLGPDSLARSLVLYHSLGSGKTITAIHVFQELFHRTGGKVNMYLLIQASQKDNPWKALMDLFVDPTNEGGDQVVWEKKFQDLLPEDKKAEMLRCVHFVHYNASTAYQQLDQVLRDTYRRDRKSLFVIDEAHKFIQNVYNNISQETSGQRGISVYNLIKQHRERMEKDARVLLLSGTPVVNNPFELALMFNLLRPGAFPMDEHVFRKHFVASDHTLQGKQLFQDRILGLVSFYEGTDPNMYAKKRTHDIVSSMEGYMLEVYGEIERRNTAMERRRVLADYIKQGKAKGSYTQHALTRQACTFVGPKVSETLNGKTRPRKGTYGASLHQLDALSHADKVRAEKKYRDGCLRWLADIKAYWLKLRKKDGKKWDAWVQELGALVKKAGKAGTVDDEECPRAAAVRTFVANRAGWKSSALWSMFESAPKLVQIALRVMVAPGPCMAYSQFVRMEGLETLKLVLEVFDFENGTKGEKVHKSSKLRYVEYTGDLSASEKDTSLKKFNDPANVAGKLYKLILLSPTATEGISLSNVRQIHIVEPHWNEVTIEQAIGRGIRDCSHAALPKNERVVDVYRHVVTRDAAQGYDGDTTEEWIYNRAVRNSNALESFREAMREAAVDCQLFRNVHEGRGNGKSAPRCMRYSIAERTYAPRPAYLKKFEDHADSYEAEVDVAKLTVYKIKCVIVFGGGKHSKVQDGWLDTSSDVVLDPDLEIPLGKIKRNALGVPEVDGEVYIVRKSLIDPSLKH